MKPSTEQEMALVQSGRFALVACPGSGKTFTVAQRLARRITKWDKLHAGIAALSFTNVAHQEIASQLKKHGLFIGRNSIHYLGTLDSFINRWIFLPFGSRVMGCKGRPTIVGFDGLRWDVGELLQRRGHPDCYGCNLLDLTYDPDHPGELVLASKKVRTRKDCPHGRSYCRDLKAKTTAKGYASQADATYWALQVLIDFPVIGRALTKRFPEIIVDEAQDTSDVQMRVFDRLCDLGLQELMLVGDPDQAIFEWRDAKPELLLAKTRGPAGWGRHLTLHENRRSSQVICDTAIGFSQCRCDRMCAVGDYRDSSLRPLFVEYPPTNPELLTHDLRKVCDRVGVVINPSSVAILVRGHDLLKQILGHSVGFDDSKDPWANKISHLVASAAYGFSNKKDPGRSIRQLEHALARVCFGDRYFTDPELRSRVCECMGERQWRFGLFSILKNLPGMDMALDDWTIEASNQLAAALTSLGWPVRKSENCRISHKTRLQGVTGLKRLPVASFFRQTGTVLNGMTVETIHAAKGKTYEVVLYVISPGRKKGNAKQLGRRKNPNSEELRTTYVALTRPRQLLMVAVPQETDHALLWRFARPEDLLWYG